MDGRPEMQVHGLQDILCMLVSLRKSAGVICALAVAMAAAAGCGGLAGDDDSQPDGAATDAGVSDGSPSVDGAAGDGALGPDGGLGELRVDYTYGNQIVASYVKMDRFGAVTHSERTCCPPRTDPVPASPLSVQELLQLEAWIQAAENGAEMTVSEPAAAGAMFGALVVYRSGRQINIRTIASTATQRTTTFNTSQAAMQLQQFVVRYATNQMPQ